MLKLSWQTFYKSKLLLKPNSCSSRIPTNRRLIMLTSRWTSPTWSHMQVTRRHPCPSSTTKFRKRAPSFVRLQRVAIGLSYDVFSVTLMVQKFEANEQKWILQLSRRHRPIACVTRGWKVMSAALWGCIMVHGQCRNLQDCIPKSVSMYQENIRMFEWMSKKVVEPQTLVGANFPSTYNNLRLWVFQVHPFLFD